MPIDFKKTQKELHLPKITPSVVGVPPMVFIAIDGVGDPNTSAAYAAAVATLYALSYAIKMGNKAILEYVVPPLEGFWTIEDDTFKGGGSPILDKSKFAWTMLIRQPDFVSETIFDNAKEVVVRKNPSLVAELKNVRLISFVEGLCVQIMHIGAYDDEPASIAKLDNYAVENGYIIDISNTRRHHEIYLSDPRKIASEKLKTVIRHPIKL
ncbi:MAG: GyrI-like domain-containing protein [Defluviitaleaceae bacterium]|nr:GyrI-like domain-containing protein [Defluviitaleaceae bacterium]